MKREMVSRITSTLLLIGILSILLTKLPIAKASPLTLLSVSPTSIVDPALGPGSTFSIDITVADVSAMWGYQFVLSYDTGILTATGYSSYDPFTLVWLSEINDAEGWVSVSYSMMLGEVEGFSTVDPAPIARIDFTVDAYGESLLDLHDTEISNVLGELISHEVVDGYFRNVPPPETGTIAGTVTDADTGLPIEGATVTADGYSTTTDSSGYYQIEVSAPETYDVIAEASGYFSDTSRATVTVGESTTVDFALEPVPAEVGWIEGTVTDADTALPIGLAIVTANGYSDFTDYSGFYSLEVSPGTYDVTVEMTGYLSQTELDVSVAAEETVVMDFALSPVSMPSTVVSVDPPTIIDEALAPGSAFSIDITIADVQKLWGYQFVLSYNTGILTAANFGIYLPFENMILPWSRIDDTEGNVYLAAYTYMGDLNGFTTIDPEPMAWVEFIVDDVGTSALDIYDSKLSDPSGNPIPHEEADGYFDNASPMEVIQRLIEVIKTWNLPKGTENSLTSKLEDALHLLEMGNENRAKRKLIGFINKVEALRGKKLTDEQADYLAAGAQRIIQLIKG